MQKPQPQPTCLTSIFINLQVHIIDLTIADVYECNKNRRYMPKNKKKDYEPLIFTINDMGHLFPREIFLRSFIYLVVPLDKIERSY